MICKHAVSWRRTLNNHVLPFVLDCRSLGTATSAGAPLVFSCHPAGVVMKSSLAVRLAEGNPGMSGIDRSAWDCWVSLTVIAMSTVVCACVVTGEFLPCNGPVKWIL